MEYTYEDPFDSEQAYAEEVPIRKRKKKRHLPLLLLLCIAIAAVLLPYPQTASQDRGWNMILVNSQNLVPEDFVEELVTLSNGQKVDRRIYPALQQMFDDMREQGVYPIVASGYRTEEYQKKLLLERVEEYRDDGRGIVKAWQLALNWVAWPGTSEHQLGIAVDINQEAGRSTAQEVYDWLANNAHLYGFICRYPEDKVHITGISKEPWHYRYVGIEDAAIMWELGLCLEEYLALE